MKSSRLSSLRLRDIRITDPFWSRYTKLVETVMIPYQWDILNGGNNALSNCIRNFKIAAGLEQGEYKGVVFMDTDIYKWLEAVAFCLETNYNEKLGELADSAIELISKAQCEDGYLNTYFTLACPDKRWSNLVEGHELYAAGHLIEAAVAYYNATGKRKLLDVAIRFANLIDSVFGREEGKIRGYSGHPEIELALFKLYKVTNDKKYLSLAKYFICERGAKPSYFEQEIKKRGDSGKAEYFEEFNNYDLRYSQSHMPPKDQKEATGHAVRALYLYCAMADIADECDDGELINACETLWQSVVKRRMYVTGSVGSAGFLECFTTDYDLPNDTNYSETCASIGLALFGLRMTSIKRESSYMDIVETALYNNLLAAIGLEGDKYFYVNPLEVWPQSIEANISKAHVKPQRQQWFDVACCPTNAARTLASLGQYIYLCDEKSLYVNLFIENEAEFSLGGHGIKTSLSGAYLKDGKSELRVCTDKNADFRVLLRIPAHAQAYSFTLNEKPITPSIEKGYAVIDGPWEHENTIGICFNSPPVFIAANPQVRADAGKVALRKGPMVYCLEEVDNGANLSSVFVDISKDITEKEGSFMLSELHYQGYRLAPWEDELYASASFKMTEQALRAVPYAVWGNRGAGEMLVWQNTRL